MSDEDLPRYDSDSDGGSSVVTGGKRVKKSLAFPFSGELTLGSAMPECCLGW